MSDQGIDGFSKHLFENILRQVNEQAETLDRVFSMLDAMIDYFRERDPEFVEIVSTYGEMELELDEGESEDDTQEEKDKIIVMDSIEDNLERSIPFNVAHIHGNTAGGFYNPTRGCTCTPFDCPFKNNDCEIIQIIKKQQKTKEDHEDQYIPPQE